MLQPSINYPYRFAWDTVLRGFVLLPEWARSHGKRSALVAAIGLATLGAGPVQASCTATPSGTTATSGILAKQSILAPQSGDTVTCTGLQNQISVANPKAKSVVVNVATGNDLLSTSQAAAIGLLGPGTIVNNGGFIFSDDSGRGVISNAGTITLVGAGNQIFNSGRIEARDAIAIQGALNKMESTGTVLVNSGKISNTNDTAVNPSGVVKFGSGAQITNSGQILSSAFANEFAITVGDGSRVENQAKGLIEATEQAGVQARPGVSGLQMGGGSTLINAGTIKVLIDTNGSGAGTAVTLNGAGSTIENSGTIDASQARTAINGRGANTIINAGSILGGTSGAIAFTNGEGSEVTLRTGSQIQGNSSVTTSGRALKTLAELGNNQQAFTICQQHPVDACYKFVQVLPNRATLGLEGTGSEDDHFSGFNLIEKRGSGDWTLGTNLQAGSATDSFQTGDFLGPLNVDVQDAAGKLALTGAITDNADGTAGQLIKNGTGTLTLSGANTYSGATNINSGKLLADGGSAIGDNSAVTIASGASLSLAGPTNRPETIGSLAGAGDVFLQNHALIVGNDNTSTTFAGAINDAGALTKIGTGTLRLSGTSSSTGLINVIDGTLDAAGTTPMDVGVSLNGNVSGSGTLGSLQNFGRVTPGDADGSILTVSGNYTQAETGVLVINAQETASTGLTATQLNVGGKATFSDQPSTIDVKFEANATIPALEGIRIVNADGGLAGTAPHVTLDPASLPNGQNFTLDLEATNLGGTFAKPGEVIPVGAGGFGAVVLQAKNLNPTKQVINAQYTAINGNYAVPTSPVIITPPQAPVLIPPTPTQSIPSLAPVLVKGQGAKIVTPMIAAQPGQTIPPKTGFQVQNGGVQIAGSTLVPTPTTPNGGTPQPGAVPIGTANAVVTVTPPTNLGTTNFVSVTGSYGAVDQSKADPGSKFRLAYAPHSVTVYNTPSNYGNLAPLGISLTSAQSQVGNALTAKLPEAHARATDATQAALVNGLYPLSVSQIADALDSIAGEGTDPTFVTAMNSRLFQQAIETRLQGQRSGALVGGYASAGDSAAGPAIWGTAIGGFGSGDYLRNSDLTTGGFVLGTDSDLDNGWTAGGAVGYAHTEIDPGQGGNADVGSLEVAAYANWTDDAWFATGLTGFGYHWLDMDRAVKVGNQRETANSSPDGQGVFVAATAGKRIDVKHATLEPAVGLRYDHVWRDSFKESGTAFANRQIDNENLDAAQASVGVRAYTDIELDNMSLKPEVNAGYAREIGSTAITSNASLVSAPGSSFTVVTEGPGQDVGILGARLTGEHGSTTFFLDYHAEIRSEFTGHVARAGININF